MDPNSKTVTSDAENEQRHAAALMRGNSDDVLDLLATAARLPRRGVPEAIAERMKKLKQRW
jgi:hypothetical protein